jgi:hypothetical protein
VEVSQEKLSQHQESIKDIEYPNLVYIDESGIDMAICKEEAGAEKKLDASCQKEWQILRANQYYSRIG